MAEPLGSSFEEVYLGRTISSELHPAFRTNDFFYGVSPSLVDACVAVFRVSWLRRATLLYHRNGVSTLVFLIVRGAVQLEYSVAGINHVITTLHGGTFTGEGALMPDSKTLHQVTATCVSPTLVCWAQASDLMHLLGCTPQIALNVGLSLHARVADTLLAIDNL